MTLVSRIMAVGRGALLKWKVSAAGRLKSIGPTTVIRNNGSISVGEHSTICPHVKLVAQAPKGQEPAQLMIGSFSSIGNRTEIHCGHRVEIGNRVLIAWDVNILEYDYHAAGGGDPDCRPIVIEDEVWVCACAIILKGVRIGRGAIVGAGAVVTKNVPPFTLVAGNPAKVIKKVGAHTGSSDDD